MRRRPRTTEYRRVLSTFTPSEVLAALRHAYPDRVVITDEDRNQGRNIYGQWTDHGMVVSVVGES